MKKTTIALGVLGAAALAAGVMVVGMRSKMKGPPAPACAIAPLARKTFLEPPVQISSPRAPGARVYDIEPMAAVASDGAIAVVYNARNHMLWGSGLVTARIELDGKVTSHHVYEDDRLEAFDAWMASCPDGKLRMVWLGHDGGQPDKRAKIGYAESADGRTWSPPRAAHTPAECPEGMDGCLDKPMIACTHDAVVVAYYSEATGGLQVTTSTFTPTKFGPSVTGGGGAYGDIETSPRIHMAFAEGREGVELTSRLGDPSAFVAYVRSDDGGKTFSAPVSASDASEPVPFLFSNAQVASDDARGFLYVIYPTGLPDGRWDIRLATSKDDGKTWTRITINDDASCASHMTPHAALDPVTGILHVTWLENRTGKGGLAYAACEPGGARCGKNEAVSAEPFASYSYERHLRAWLSEYGALIIDPERRLLHALWTQPVDEDGDATSRVFYARAKL